MKINLHNQRIIFSPIKQLNQCIESFIGIDDLLRSHPKLNLENNEYLFFKKETSWMAGRRMTGFIQANHSSTDGLLFETVDLSQQLVEEETLVLEPSIEAYLEKIHLNSNEMLVLQSQELNGIVQASLKKRKFAQKFI